MRTNHLLITIVACLALAGPASAATTTVNFDDLPPKTTNSKGYEYKTEITDQYRASHGVYWLKDPGYPPVVDVVPGQASSGNNVANTIEGCFACEFVSGFTRGYFTTTVRSVSLNAGVINDTYEGTSTAVVTLKGFDAGGNEVAKSSPTTLTEGAGIKTKIEIGSPTSNIATYTLSARGGEDVGKMVAFDDLSFETPDVAPPPDFSFYTQATTVSIPQGLSRNVEVTLNRINGSNGDVDFSVTGLPQGVTGTFDPDPVPGDGGRATLTLTAASDAPVGPVAEATIIAKPAPGAGGSERRHTIYVWVGENCTREVKFAYADVRAKCLRQESDGVYVAYGQVVKVNGLELVPSASEPLPGEKVIVDTNARRIHTDGGVYAIALPTDPEVPLFANRIDWTLPASGGPHQIADVNTSSFAKLGGLQLKSAKVAFTQDQKTMLTPTFRLNFWPFTYIGGVGGGTSLLTSNDGGIDFRGFSVSVGKIPMPGIDLKDVKLAWDGQSTWSGGATVVLKFAGSKTLSAGFVLRNGEFSSLSAAVANLNAPIFAGVYLQRLGISVQRDPLQLQGQIGMSAGPSVAGQKAVTIDGSLTATFADPFTIKVAGSAKLGGRWEMAQASLKYKSNGYVELNGSADWDLKVGSIKGSISGWVYRTEAFNIEGSVRGCIYVKWAPDPCAGAKALISSKGIAACVEIYWVSGGIGYRWGGDFDLFSGCDLGAYRAEKPAGASASSLPGARASSRSRTVTLPAGLPKAVIALDGEDLPPLVTISGPNGERVRVSRSKPMVQNDRFVAVAGENGTTYVVIREPAAGEWKIETARGSEPIEEVRKAYGLPEVSVSAEVAKRGGKRVLKWNLRRIAGQTVRFVELGGGSARTLAETTRSHGSVKFRPTRGGKAKRRVVAYVEQGGMPRATVRVAKYRAR